VECQLVEWAAWAAWVEWVEWECNFRNFILKNLKGRFFCPFFLLNFSCHGGLKVVLTNLCSLFLINHML
jgi:hypothetical protein